MPTRPKRSRDPVQAAHQVYLEIIGEAPALPETAKDPAAVRRGTLGGLKGGPSRAANLPPKRREEIARKAAEARWKKPT